ncbi:carbon starvation CstA family protein, partial [Morganella morganii]
DFMVLFISSRRNGASLGEIVKEEMGTVPGTIALFGCFLIMIIILAGFMIYQTWQTQQNDVYADGQITGYL